MKKMSLILFACLISCDKGQTLFSRSNKFQSSIFCKKYSCTLIHQEEARGRRGYEYELKKVPNFPKSTTSVTVNRFGSIKSSTLRLYSNISRFKSSSESLVLYDFTTVVTGGKVYFKKGFCSEAIEKYYKSGKRAWSMGSQQGIVYVCDVSKGDDGVEMLSFGFVNRVIPE